MSPQSGNPSSIDHHQLGQTNFAGHLKLHPLAQRMPFKDVLCQLSLEELQDAVLLTYPSNILSETHIRAIVSDKMFAGSIATETSTDNDGDKSSGASSNAISAVAERGPDPPLGHRKLGLMLYNQPGIHNVFLVGPNLSIEYRIPDKCSNIMRKNVHLGFSIKAENISRISHTTDSDRMTIWRDADLSGPLQASSRGHTLRFCNGEDCLEFLQHLQRSKPSIDVVGAPES